MEKLKLHNNIYWPFEMDIKATENHISLTFLKKINVSVLGSYTNNDFRKKMANFRHNAWLFKIFLSSSWVVYLYKAWTV